MARPPSAHDLIAPLRDNLALRAKSLIITIYGDAILPHGGAAWLGSLIRLVAPLGLSERVVRTAVFRLAKDDWLTSHQVGRRSYYSLTESGRRRFEAAHRRIYAARQIEWDGHWKLVLAGPDLAADQRDALRRELGWLGFGQLAPNVLAHPTPDVDAMQQAILGLGVGSKVVVMNGASDGGSLPEALPGLVEACWDLRQLDKDYQGFLEAFRPVWRAIEQADNLDPEMCFLVRALLIHDYRRVLLRDPQLPDALLPLDWSGTASRLLCRNLYLHTLEPAQRHVMSLLETADGPVTDPAPSFFTRFGGIAGGRGLAA